VLAQPATNAINRHIAHDGMTARFVDIFATNFIVEAIQKAQSGAHHKAQMQRYFNCERLATVSRYRAAIRY
jgi:hypothetical protein